MHLVTRNLVDLCLGVHYDVEHSQGVIFYVLPDIERVDDLLHISNGKMPVRPADLEMDSAQYSLFKPDRPYIGNVRNIGQDLLQGLKRNAGIDKRAYHHIAAYPENRVYKNYLHNRFMSVA